ncbi:HdeD family acid-resistance protein [Haloarchaeobius sp. DYHT-AS-18]|uniref:HdeD family acid-resistance protein n=1 Tax=Haloarchaeobius sp. DYHT-AS-18 TaxID=3446117 RepID=UPI003EB7731A
MSADDIPEDRPDEETTSEAETPEMATESAPMESDPAAMDFDQSEQLTPEAAGIASSYSTMIAVGAVLAILGFLAIVFPIFTSLSLSVVFGAALVVGAFVQIAHAFSAKKWTGFLWQTILALVYGVAGIMVLANPVLGLASLTFLLIGYFFASGVVQLVMGLQTRGQPNWGWLLFSGGLGILVGVMLFLGLPSTAAWAVGLLFGANLLASGLSMIMLAVGAKEAAEAGEVTPPTAKPGGV